MIRSGADARRAAKKRQEAGKLQHSNGKPHFASKMSRPLVPPSSNDDGENLSRFDGTGFQVWKNPKNRFCVIRWHYTADPAKRDPAYEREGRAKNPQGWDQEMEIDFRSKRGVKVFGEFPWKRAECNLGTYWSKESNVILPAAPAPSWWPLYLATDPGRNRCWATLFVKVDEYGCWHVVGSVVEPGMHYTQAKKKIKAILGRVEPVEHVIDPASKQQRTDSLKTLIEKMADRPNAMQVIPVDHLGNEYMELEELRERMMLRSDGRYGMYFWDFPFNARCIEQFRNAVYKDEYGEKLDSIDVDAVDAGKYLATHMTGRAIRPRKPPDQMSPREYRASLATDRRRRLEKQLTDQQRAYNSLRTSGY